MSHAVATKAMIPSGRGGKIMNVTLSPHHGLPGMAHSSAARAAVENLTRVLSIEWARFGIKLTALAAGHFDTETLRTKYPKPVVESVARTVPLQRLGTEEEFAWLVAFLASPGGRLPLGLDPHDRRRARQLVRPLAAGRPDRRVRQAARRGAQAEARVIPRLETERLLLRGFEERDLDAYAAMTGDPEVMRYMGRGPFDRDEAWREIALYLGHFELRGYTHWALELRETGELVGRCGPWRPEGWPGLEVGLAAGPRALGQRLRHRGGAGRRSTSPGASSAPSA